MNYDEIINNKRLDNTEIRNFLFKCYMILFSIIILTYIPGIIVLNNKILILNNELFKKYWWSSIIFAFIYFSITAFIYVNINKLTDKNSKKIFFFFPLLVIILLCIYTCFSFYSVELMLTFSGMISLCLLLSLFFNLFSIFDNKNWIKLTTLFSIVFVYLIVYMITVKINMVEFFILCVFSISFFSYITIQMKHLIYSFAKNDSNYLSFRYYLTAISISSIDMLTCTIK